ncbi:hypothetical protein AAF712_007469 [Marasmius tenuissimus]|uniref:TPR-like protein n=1 Tax=Marasmius tenuissimus TaxID=585030 RepID=A0ABR2ZVX0_9AGAR
MDSSHVDLAQKLKDEGNALFAQKSYASASAKYSEAIALDDKSPILYANRSACRLNLRQFLDAATDAFRATELSPTYGKAWARLATARDALRQPWVSVEAWKKALGTLSKDDLSEAEIKQKAEYEAGLSAASKALELNRSGADVGPRLEYKNDDRSLTPWMCALALMPQLERERNHRSSAWTIAHAYLDLEKGNELLSHQKVQMKDGAEQLRATLRAIEHLSNAIMMDSRVFHIGSQDWIERFNRQCEQFAFSMEEGHSLTCGSSMNITDRGYPLDPRESSNKRKRDWRRKGGIVSWILLGFLDGGARQNHVSEAEHITRALEVIEWGRKTWPDVPSKDRGVIFMDTFVRGVQKLRIEALVEASTQEKDASSRLQRLEELLVEAEKIIKDIDDGEQSNREENPSVAAAFCYYPRGHARGAKAFYYGRKAELSEDKDECRELHGEAAMTYLEALEDFCEDDEQYTLYLNAALQHMLKAGAPVGFMLKQMERLRDTIPKTQPIWGKMMSIQQAGESRFEHVLKYEKHFRDLLAEGKITEDVGLGLTFLTDDNRDSSIVLDI